jgi:hypothetical protein
MILSFSKQFKDGTPNFFIHKIWQSIFESDLIPNANEEYIFHYLKDFQSKFGCSWDEQIHGFNPKKHTIREDKHDRWHAGQLIHPVVFNRSKNRFQFAPAFSCVSTQNIEIKKNYHMFEVFIDDKLIGHYFPKPNCYDSKEIKQLSLNDGFNSVEQFLEWFNRDFSGKIIHWTSLKY